MRNRPMARFLWNWERLEDRRCPSAAAATAAAVAVGPQPDQPLLRTDAYSLERHAQDLTAAAIGSPNVVFYGDSITDWFADGAGRSVWAKQVAPMGAVDFGVSGDLTENLLERIDTGEVATSARVAVVLIGTNNLTYRDSPTAVAQGVSSVVGAIRSDSPGTRVLVLGVLPRGLSTAVDFQSEIRTLNADLASLSDGDAVRFLDVNPAFSEPDGTINPALTLDGLHPNAQGYQVLTNALNGTLREMLAEPRLGSGSAVGPTVPATVSSLVGPVSPTAPTVKSPAVTATPTAAVAGPLTVADLAPDAGEYVAPSIAIMTTEVAPTTRPGAHPRLTFGFESDAPPRL